MTKRILCVLSLALAAAAVSPVAGADGHVERYVVPSTFYIDDDDKERQIDDQFGGLQFMIGKSAGPWWDLEYGGFWANWDGADESDQYGLVFDSHLRFLSDRTRAVSPYLLIGSGYMSTNSSLSKDENGLIASLGFGIDWRLNPGVALRTEARVRRDFAPSDYAHDFLFSAGLRVGLGDPTPPPPPDSDGDGVRDDMDRCPGTPAGAPVDARGCELDSDGDGVVDRLDRCPGTPRGVKVDAQGCPARDSDGDGVPDASDRCPGTPAGAKVDARGCELDGDGDGVVDRLDQCPNTPRGERVNGVGCPLQREIRLEGVFFEFDSARLRDDARQRLDQAVRTLELNPDLRIEIAGHTDALGPESYNQGLSQRRAESVRTYLIDHGIDGARLTARGYGESDPIATNDTEPGRAQNRRVMMRILNQDISNPARPAPN